MPMNPTQHVESVAQQILASIHELRKAVQCPECKQHNLKVEFHADSLMVICHTPKAPDLEGGGTFFCPFNMVVNPVDLSRAPFTFGFAATEQDKRKPPVVQRARKATATTRKKVTRRRARDTSEPV